MDSIKVYEVLMAKVAQRIINRSLSEYDWERETIPRQVKLANYIRERFSRYLNAHNPYNEDKPRDAKRVVVFIRSAELFQF